MYYIIYLIIFIIILSVLQSISGYVLLNISNYILSYGDIKQEYYSTDIDWCKKLRDNYDVIMNEYLNYNNTNKLKRFKDIDKVQTKYDISDIPWEVLFLRVYNKDTDKIKYFPKTFELISNIPGCSLAMFSILHPGKIIPPHNGPYKGVLRYHLALTAPKDINKCYIVVNDKKYHWETGKDVMFDDTFLHHVKNESDETRIVLFLDIKKEFNNYFLNKLNDCILYFGKFNDTVKTIVKNTNES